MRSSPECGHPVPPACLTQSRCSPNTYRKCEQRNAGFCCCHGLAVPPWASCLPSLCLSVSICKTRMGMDIPKCSSQLWNRIPTSPVAHPHPEFQWKEYNRPCRKVHICPLLLGEEGGEHRGCCFSQAKKGHPRGVLLAGSSWMAAACPQREMLQGSTGKPGASLE